MKADVRPAALPRLEIPSWVPPAVAQGVGARYAAEVDLAYQAARRSGGYFGHEAPDDVARADAADLVRDVVARWRPLVADRRMEGVWGELSRRRNGAFLHRALPPLCQDAAMLALFDAALACRKLRGTTTTQRQAKLGRDRYLAKAAELRDDAMTMPLLSWRDNWLERHQRLEAAAQAYEDYAGEFYATSFPVSLEREHDGRARWVALSIGNTFRTLFGWSMYRLTTKVTSVILDRDVDPRTVRYWLDPAVKCPKISS